jgi:hypothetical protein
MAGKTHIGPHPLKWRENEPITSDGKEKAASF